ncbi:MAG: hypothetical protein C5B57_13470 [Blastocatellia bacterium]|nr:MAG: hypothetical protein C5B57_13470 [Blastocatellia bacterium]
MSRRRRATLLAALSITGIHAFLGPVLFAQTADPPTSRPSGISGYMEVHFTNPDEGDAVFDFRRFVLLFTHRFSERIRFISELEVEHAVVEGLEEKGEVELEQAYLDFMIDRRFNIRAGQLLVPVGLINERHEPPVFHGVQRPFVDTFIIPTTWFDAGVGAFGQFGHGWRYRVYAMAPLTATEISAEEGLAESPQQGSRAIVRHFASTGRLEYVGIRRLALGTSFWTGKSATDSARLNPRVTIAEADGRGRVGRIDLRGQYAHVFIQDAGELNRLLQVSRGTNPNVASQMLGAYLEAAHPVLFFPSAPEVVGFVRYERFDTQYRMPAGFVPIQQFQRSAWVFGVSYYPDPDVAVKIDYTVERNASSAIKAPRSLNVGLGWWF